LAQNKTIYEQRKRHEYQTHIDFWFWLCNEKGMTLEQCKYPFIKEVPNYPHFTNLGGFQISMEYTQSATHDYI
jgi:hypothetical protein